MAFWNKTPTLIYRDLSYIHILRPIEGNFITYRGLGDLYVKSLG